MTEHLDVVIVGAGISGISTAWHLQERCPTKSYAILERRENIGGTWDLFKYPGIRSDSDMFTLGFRFKPWTSAHSIADGKSIWNYINEAADENGIKKHIRVNHRVVNADWSDADNKWTLTVDNNGEEKQITCSFLSVCSGYYNYDQGYSPEFPGAADFKGKIIHPQHWPESLDYAGKKIVVIGSGATAVTLIPSLVKGGAGHVTMLQRSPTYIGSLPLVDPIAEKTNKYLPKNLAHFVNRWKAIGFSTAQYQLARRFPQYMRKTLLTMAKHRLPEGYDVEKHFGPRYNPWDERLCLAPNGDLFKTIKAGKADVVTDTIDTFTETGIKLNSGEQLQADIIITATGLNMQLFGGASVTRNGEEIDLTKSMTYKGLMLSGVPNMAITFGYTNASWTLKADLVSEFICRVLNFMDANGFDKVEPEHPGEAVDELPFMDFTPGYFRRAMDSLPKSGSEAPWRLKQNYFFDLRTIRHGKVDEESLHFTKHRAAVTV
ncbi:MULTISPECIES: flavin-containing monooxygenase [Mycolicibacterium]|uniref:FAD-containing monooxygenase EthA n=1 Tax=Mycolicibacterium mageritense TaxID=53462 RepID=A0AAI8XMM5_MYCME|nr:NAD(P)/FAD-dependent oxidoreductase [Mycolicibacterium mageritense]MBN3455567.1 NAD(P)/FAD-dependent oxidoreductase [Mycobacterium sp. DSM 3803]OKH62435.1 FAD-containing monooxygenase EthA [Mycobacterium sp. SWH-M3]TXI62581.1 MAG: NAD(P)/FAD-dependent oxidoreductase [Mycolicibacterium mageritense]BDY27898.1 FAD-containing monooxygenase EthA [Mycolicibacterium mageritense]GJJ20511.1 FAD-containing monooxygenase EthA [Mycolicibacterium mageritense]